MAEFAIALQTIFDQYEISTKDLEILSGTSHSTLHHWTSDRSRPSAHRIPPLANALDLLIVDGGSILLSNVFGMEFGPCRDRPSPVDKALQIVFGSYRITAAQVAIAANVDWRNLSSWKVGRARPRFSKLIDVYRALETVRPGAGRLMLMHFFGRSISDSSMRSLRHQKLTG